MADKGKSAMLKGFAEADKIIEYTTTGDGFTCRRKPWSVWLNGTRFLVLWVTRNCKAL
jgi:hypothetical protein